MVFVPWVKVSLLKISLYRLGLTSDHTDSLLPSWGNFWVKIVHTARKTMNHATSRENKHVSEMPCTLHSCGTRQLFNEIVTRPLGFYDVKEEIYQRSLSWWGKSHWSEIAWAVDALKRGSLSYCWVPRAVPVLVNVFSLRNKGNQWTENFLFSFMIPDALVHGQLVNLGYLWV